MASRSLQSKMLEEAHDFTLMAVFILGLYTGLLWLWRLLFRLCSFAQPAGKLEPNREGVEQASARFIQTLKSDFRGRASLNEPSRLRREVTVLDIVRQHLHDKSYKLKRQLNAHAPIHELPPELFVNILLLVIRNKAVPRRDLASVCHSWSRVIISTPILWSDIRSDDQDALLAFYKSQNALLHIHGVPGAELGPHSSAFLQFLQGAARCKRRLKAVYLRVNNPQQLAGLQVCLQGDEMLALLDLSIGTSPTLTGTRFTVPQGFEYIDLAGIRSLRRLSASGINLQWSSARLSNLRSLHLSDLLDTRSPRLAQVQHILTSSPQLETLSLVNVAIPPSNEQTSPESLPITMPSLRSMRLQQLPPASLSLLLSIIEAPSLHSFWFAGQNEEAVAQCAPGLVQIAGPLFRSAPCITLIIDHHPNRNSARIETRSHGAPRNCEHIRGSPWAKIDIRFDNATSALKKLVEIVKAFGTKTKIALFVTSSCPEDAPNCLPGEILDTLSNLESIKSSCDHSLALIEYLREVRYDEDDVPHNPCRHLDYLNLGESIGLAGQRAIEYLLSRRINRIREVRFTEEVVDPDVESDLDEDGDGF